MFDMYKPVYTSNSMRGEVAQDAEVRPPYRSQESALSFEAKIALYTCHGSFVSGIDSLGDADKKTATRETHPIKVSPSAPHFSRELLTQGELMLNPFRSTGHVRLD